MEETITVEAPRRRPLERVFDFARSLFPAPGTEPFSRRAYGLLALAIVVASAVSLSRSRGPGPLDSVWIEDAHVFLTDAYLEGPGVNLFNSFFGYYHVGPRLIAEFAAWVPARLAAPVLGLSSALITSGFAAVAYLGSGRFFPQWWLRVLAAAPVVLLPLGRTQADNDVATLHFAGLYAIFWVMLWRPAGWGARFAAVAVTLFVTFSSILPILFLPLLLLRLFTVRDWTTRAIAAAYGAGMAVQIGGMVTGDTTREGTCCRRYEPLWVIDEYLTKAIPRTLFGEKRLGGSGVDGSGFPQPLDIPSLWGHRLLIVAAGLVVLAAVACAVWRLTNPHWPLAIVAGGASLVVFAVEVTNLGVVHPRYVIVPGLLLLTGLGALLRPHDGPGRPRSRWPAVALMVVLAVVSVTEFRVSNGRTISRPWHDIVREAYRGCHDYIGPDGQFIVYGPEWWRVVIPCEKFY